MLGVLAILFMLSLSPAANGSAAAFVREPVIVQMHTVRRRRRTRRQAHWSRPIADGAFAAV
jgi:hypothetical protein